MARRTRDRAPLPSAQADSALVAVGLRPGDLVRWRRADGDRWREGTVERVERDGSIGLRDAKGAARAIALERLEVRTRGPRGGVQWDPVAVRAERDEQLELFR
jgi:hypothetical protein